MQRKRVLRSFRSLPSLATIHCGVLAVTVKVIEDARMERLKTIEIVRSTIHEAVFIAGSITHWLDSGFSPADERTPLSLEA